MAARPSLGRTHRGRPLAFLALIALFNCLMALSCRAGVLPRRDPDGEKNPQILRFVHITDLHLDAQYSPDASAADFCHSRPMPASSASQFFTSSQRQPFSRQSRLGMLQPQWKRIVDDGTSEPPLQAKWGRLGTPCDSPLRLVTLATRFVGNLELDPDYVLWTGDSARHDRDIKLQRNEFEVFDSNERCARLLAQAMRPPSRDKDGKRRRRRHNVPGDGLDSEIKIFPAVGNLDVHPHNLLDPPSNTTHLQQLARALVPVIPPTSSAGISLAANGTYHHVLAGGKLHIVSINTIYWTKENVWARGDCDDPNSPGAQLIDWTNATLADIGQTPGAKAILLGHVPPATGSGGSSGNLDDDPEPGLPPILDSNYKPACHVRYLDVLERHAHVIASMHSGHVNEDSTLFVARVPFSNGTSVLGMIDAGDYARRAENSDDHKALDDIRLLVPVYSAPSVIPVYNPGVRVMEFDLERGEWKRWTQYYLDLDLATRRDNGLEDKVSGLVEADQKNKKKRKKRRKHKKPHQPAPIGDGPAVFLREYSTDAAYGMPSLSVHSWRTAMTGAPPPTVGKPEDDAEPEDDLSDEDVDIGDDVKVMRGDGGRRGAAREFRQKYRYFYSVKGPYDDDS
ncbi:hypothetical protein BCR44DRAFT_39281 [Catenaria anguillulae PL171]|uniref:Uncharacterized protein n=1 Tax=Catenaria anguillulae PL171 TaxID=765915 RepID=A0A1Y2I6P4_9FUNG|nr:hypothetical protein BCR44DRAFT_39281 [Catenaria anguillulae PL171]